MSEPDWEPDYYVQRIRDRVAELEGERGALLARATLAEARATQAEQEHTDMMWQRRRADERAESLVGALRDLAAWAEAYPKSVFLPPDYKSAHHALQAVGMTLDAISADIMRTALDEVGRRARSALSASDHPAE